MHTKPILITLMTMTFLAVPLVSVHAQFGQGILNNKNKAKPAASVTPSVSVSPSPRVMNAAQCEAKKNQILQKSQTMETTKQAHLHVYQKIRERLVQAMATLKSQNKDTAVLEANLVLLDDKIATFTADVDDLIAQLPQVSSVDCTKGGMTDFLTQLQPYIDQVQLDVSYLKQFYMTTIRQYLIGRPGKRMMNGKFMMK